MSTKYISGTTFFINNQVYSIPDGKYTEEQVVNALTEVFDRNAKSNSNLSAVVSMIDGCINITPTYLHTYITLNFGTPPNGAGNLGWSTNPNGENISVILPATAPFQFISGAPNPNPQRPTNPFHFMNPRGLFSPSPQESSRLAPSPAPRPVARPSPSPAPRPVARPSPSPAPRPVARPSSPVARPSSTSTRGGRRRKTRKSKKSKRN